MQATADILGDVRTLFFGEESMTIATMSGIRGGYSQPHGIGCAL